jgi:hypothetical protein
MISKCAKNLRADSGGLLSMFTHLLVCRRTGFCLIGITLWTFSAVSMALSAEISASTQKPGNIFQESDALSFDLENSESGPAEWRVVDWRGKLVATGSVSGATLSLPPPALGYYELQFRPSGLAEWSDGVPFARIVDQSTRRRDPGSFIALDAAFSFLTRPTFYGNSLQPADAPIVAADIVALSGVSMIRERSWWADGTHPRPGVFDWSFLEKNAALLAGRGVRIQNMFEGVPSWARKSDGEYDLWALHEFTEAAGRQFGGRATAWEIWNEIDAKPAIPVWDYVSAHKAAYLGFKKASKDTTVLNAPVANVRTHQEFLDLIFENGIGDYMDGFSYHTYAAPERYQEEMSLVKDALSRHQLAGTPIWITEAGWRQAGNLPALQRNGRMSEHDREQAVVQAERLVKAQVMLHALGAFKVFSFVLFPFNENNGRDCWGLLRWDWKVKPGYVALANLTAQLGNSELAGGAPVQNGVTSFLFQKTKPAEGEGETGQTLVAWADDETTFALSSSSQQLEVVDLMGKSRVLTPDEDGRFRVQVGVCPVYIKGTFPTVNTAAVAKETGASGVDRPVVLRVRFGGGFSVGQKAVRLGEKSPGDFTLEVFNFASEPRQLTLRSLGLGCTVQGLPAALTVPPGERKSVPLRLALPAGRRTAGELADLVIGGESATGRLSPVSVPVGTGYFEAMKKDASVTVSPFPAEDIARWKANSAGTMQISRDGKEKSIRFKTTFSDKPGGRWVYPELALKLPEESLVGSIGMTFEIKADRIARDPGEVLVMALTDKEIAENGFLRYPYRITTEWQTVEVVWADNKLLRDPADIKVLRIGCNPHQDDMTFRVRNLQMYYKK